MSVIQKEADMISNPFRKDNTGSTSNGLLKDPIFLKDEITKNMESLNSPHLDSLLVISEDLRQVKKERIVFTRPIIERNGIPILYPSTINVIQGQAGVHKSRLAECFCAAFLTTDQTALSNLGFQVTTSGGKTVVVYIDTERNLNDQFPAALQRIQSIAGIDKQADPENFKYTSLLMVPREQRFDALRNYLEHIRASTNKHIFVVLDVATDCIEDFNSVRNTNRLVDLMNITINEYDVTFLCVIHENPGSEKARGHLGSEIFNKATTHIQIGYSGDTRDNTSIYVVKFKKVRSIKDIDPIPVTYCNNTNGLIPAENYVVNIKSNGYTPVVHPDDVRDFLAEELKISVPISKYKLIELLTERFSVSSGTLEDRIKKLIQGQLKFVMEKEGKEIECVLVKERVGKNVQFSLLPVDDANPKKEDDLPF